MGNNFYTLPAISQIIGICFIFINQTGCSTEDAPTILEEEYFIVEHKYKVGMQKDAMINKELGILSRQATKYLNEGDIQKAENIYIKISKDYPKHPLSYLGLGAIALQRGNIKNSINYYKKAAEVDPDEDMAYWGLGMSYYKKQDCDNAKDSFSKISHRLSDIYSDRAKQIIGQCIKNING